MGLFLKITLAVVLVMLLWRMWPATKHWSPKGSSRDWMSFALIIAAITGFVVLMIMSVRN